MEEEEGEGELEESEEERQAKGEKIADLMSQLTAEQISEAMDSVFAEMLTDFKVTFTRIGINSSVFRWEIIHVEIAFSL